MLYFPAQEGSRAIFLAEARDKREMKQIRELFDMVGHLAQVVPISHGPLMSYAVQCYDDGALFGKVEWLLKTQFSFSLVERNLSDVTVHLIRSLCSDSGSEMIELPQCGICSAADPFATRATVELGETGEPLHLSYCARCTATHADTDEQKSVRALLRHDRRGLKVGRTVPVVPVPEIVEERPEWDADALVAVG
ncbi:MAG: hypothetical protein ACK47B_29095 [Armatimonadota bacterium]